MSEKNHSGSDAEKMRTFLEERLRDRMVVVEQGTKQLQKVVRILGVGILLAFGLIITLSLWPSVGGEDGEPLRIQHLVLEDADGVARGEWRVDEEGNSRFVLLDRDGRPRLSLSVLSGGFPGMSLIDTSGKRRAALGLLPDETTNLVFADEEGIARAVLGMGRADATHLVFADANGVSQVALGVDGQGIGTIMLPGRE